MGMPKEILISEFKAHCIAELKRVHNTGQPLIVTLRGQPIARVEPIRQTKEPMVQLGALSGQAKILEDLTAIDFSDDWEINQ